MRAMRFAAIDTSTEWCSLALWLDGEIAAREVLAGHRHGELALPMLGRLLADAGVSIERLDAVAFGAGPGSFTGLRIACGIAQGIALAAGIPVIGIPTLEAIAEESGAERVVACLDARMREVYYCALEREPESGAESVRPWRATIEPQCVAPGMAPKPSGGGWLGCGSGFSAYPDALVQALGDALMRTEPNARPSAIAVARLAAPRLSAGLGLDPALATPFYVRDKVALTVQERERGT